MPRSINDSNESRRRFAHLARVFSVVLERYKDILNLHPLACSQFDDDAPQNRRLDFAVIDYKTDIENACTAAIKGQRNQHELEDAIDRLVAGDQTVPETLARQVIRLVGVKFIAHRLEPSAYLRRIRRKRGERAGA